MGYPFWTYGGLLVQDQSETTQLIDYDRMYTPYKSTNPPPPLFFCGRCIGFLDVNYDIGPPR